MYDTEVDGRILDLGRDPPGQRSVYITPVDEHREVHRLTTFARFPDCAPVNPCHLAQYGFYYTGYKDRVKCFSCGQGVEDWMRRDDPSSARWHQRNCAFANGAETENVPIQPIRSQSPRTSIATPESREIPQREIPPARIAVAESANRAATFPCLEPVNPHMRERASRLGTFRDNVRSWPSHRINATPEQMVDAGLYYLGERDRVKCWYCNGGLQNWDRFDDPWFEHAKWFPSCEYLLQKKGPEYVHNVVSQYPNINRPTPVHLSRPLPQVRSNQSFSSEERANAPLIVDPREEMRRLERRVENEMRSSPFVEEAKMMGFSEEEIRFAMMRNLENHDGFHSSCEDLVESILSNPAPLHQDEEEGEEEEDSSSPREEARFSGTEVQNTLEELERLQASRLCKVCKNHAATVVLLPCGHIATCENCSRNLKICPLCKRIVSQTIKSFIA